MRLALTLAALSGLTMGQPRATSQITVAPGSQGEVLLRIAPPRQGDLIDILASDAAVRLTILLPDGRELTAENAESMGFSWTTDDASEFEGFPKIFLAGAGQHTNVGSPEGLPVGELRIRVDAQGLVKTAHVAAVRVTIKEWVMASLRATPGVKIVESVELPARSTQGKIQFALRRTPEGAHLDVAVTDPSVKVSLQFPDGRSVTKEIAKSNGVHWSVSKWPDVQCGGDCGLGVLFMFFTMLPVEGLHQLISFEDGIPLNGNYVLRFDASASHRVSEASAMFIPGVEDLLK
jgi:hypothetical protein